MARSLVIVESATKAPTINRYLGRDFTVKSSAGHVRDLPVGGKTVDPKQRADARAKEAAKTRKLSPRQARRVSRSEGAFSAGAAHGRGTRTTAGTRPTK